MATDWTRSTHFVAWADHHCSTPCPSKGTKRAYSGTKAAGHSPASSWQVHRKLWQQHFRREEAKAGTRVWKGARGPSMLHMFLYFLYCHYIEEKKFKLFFCRWIKICEFFYNLVTLNSKLKTKTRNHLTFSWNLSSCSFLAFSTTLTIFY